VGKRESGGGVGAASGREEIKKWEKVGKRYCGGSERRRVEIKKREKVGKGDCGGGRK